MVGSFDDVKLVLLAIRLLHKNPLAYAENIPYHNSSNYMS